METLIIPDVPDVLDGGDVVDGFADVGLASGCRVSRVIWWFLIAMARCLRDRSREGG